MKIVNVDWFLIFICMGYIGVFGYIFILKKRKRFIEGNRFLSFFNIVLDVL